MDEARRVTAYMTDDQLKANFNKICISKIPAGERYKDVEVIKAPGLMFELMAHFHVCTMYFEDDNRWYADVADDCNISHRGIDHKLNWAVARAVIEAHMPEEWVEAKQPRRRRRESKPETRRRRRRKAA